MNTQDRLQYHNLESELSKCQHPDEYVIQRYDAMQDEYWGLCKLCGKDII